MGLRSNSIKLGVRQKMQKKVKVKTCCTCKCTCKAKGKTYEEWRNEGMQVQRGQKATGRNADGKATFTKAQVEPGSYTTVRLPVIPWDLDDFADDDIPF